MPFTALIPELRTSRPRQDPGSTFAVDRCTIPDMDAPEPQSMTDDELVKEWLAGDGEGARAEALAAEMARRDIDF